MVKLLNQLDDMCLQISMKILLGTLQNNYLSTKNDHHGYLLNPSK